MSKEWFVPVKLIQRAEVLVVADTADEAERKAEMGEWEDTYGEDLSDWELIGKPKRNT